MNAIIYSRVSTDDQDNDRQIAELKSYAQYKKLKVVKIFQEKISGASRGADRTQFKQLLEFVETHEIDTILTWEISRLGRSMMDVLNNIEAFSERKINIFIKKEGMNTLDESKRKSTMVTLLISILSGFAEMERDAIRQRSISGIRYNVSMGGSGAGMVKAYGFEAIQKKLYVNAEEAKIVRLIFSKYISGLGTGAIAKHLNLKGVPTRFAKLYDEKLVGNCMGFKKKGKEYTWADGTIRTILTNSIYKGDRKHKGEIFKIEPIVDEQTFERVQARLRANLNKNSSKIKYFNPLKDLIKCGHPECERRSYSYWMHKRVDNKDNAYKCISKRYASWCGNPSINTDKLQKALFWICQPLIVNDAVEQKKNKNILDENIENKNIEIQNTQKQLLTLNSKLNSLIKMNLDGQIDAKRFTKMNSEFMNSIATSNDQLVVLSDEVERLMSLRKSKPISEYSLEIFNEYIREVVEHVKIHSVTNKEAFSQHLRVTNDVVSVIEVSSLLAFEDNKPALTFFAMSRYSNNLFFLRFKSDSKNAIEQVRSGEYSSELCLSLDAIDYDKPFQMKHALITKRLKYSRI